MNDVKEIKFKAINVEFGPGSLDKYCRFDYKTNDSFITLNCGRRQSLDFPVECLDRLMELLEQVKELANEKK